MARDKCPLTLACIGTTDQLKGENYRGAALALREKNPESMKKTAFIDEDFETGFRIFFANIYCPDTKVAQVYLFLRNLLSHNNDTRTIIQGVVNLAQSKAIEQGSVSQKMVNQFYETFDDAMGHLEYGKNLLATSSRARLQEMIDKDFPFFLKP